MKSYHNIITQKLGIDKSVFYTLLGRGLQIPVALGMIFFIAHYLSAVEQGFYYTFNSIVALQVFFELGLTSIITQFVAHEASHLQWDGKKFIGEEIYRSRLASLLKFCFKWYTIFAAMILCTLLIIGIYFFSKYDDQNENIEWTLPWILLSIGTVFNFLVAPINSILQGLGNMERMAKISFLQMLMRPIILWGGFMLGLNLYVLGLDALLKATLLCAFVAKSPMSKMLLSLWKEKITQIISYKNEILPLQWRIAVSWVSGYFIFQLFNPVLFATEGAKVAGQMGLTLQALNSIQALAMSWISTKIPIMSNFIALKKYNQLDNLFNRVFKQVLFIGIILIISFIIIIHVMDVYQINPLGIKLSDRFLPLLPLTLMSIAIFTTIPVNCWAAYLRGHKKEPLMVNSVVMGVLCCCSTFILGHTYGLIGITCGFTILQIISSIWIKHVFITKKQQWHYDKNI